jgi:hypothetical protein
MSRWGLLLLSVAAYASIVCNTMANGRTEWVSAVFDSTGVAGSGNHVLLTQIAAVGLGANTTSIQAFSLRSNETSVWFAFFGGNAVPLGLSARFPRVAAPNGEIAWVDSKSGWTQAGDLSAATTYTARFAADGSLVLAISAAVKKRHLFGLWHTADTSRGEIHFSRVGK